MKKNQYRLLMTASIFLILTSQGCYSGDAEESTKVRETVAGTSEIATEVPTQEQESVTEAPELTFELSTPIYGNFEFEGQKRFYFVYLPKNYSNSESFPLVIYLHSYGGAATTEMDYTMFNQVADENNFVMVFPSGKSNWNSGIGDLDDYPPPDLDDVGFIEELIELLSNTYSLDLKRVFATGYSNGGFMSYKLACELSEQIAAIASVGGGLAVSTFESCDPKRPIPIMHIHGTSDGWIPIEGLPGMLSIEETMNYWIEINGCNEMAMELIEDSEPTDNCTVEMYTYTECNGDSEIIFYKVIDGGHTWPGAGNAGYPTGYTNQDIDASLEIWNFFKDYKLP